MKTISRAWKKFNSLFFRGTTSTNFYVGRPLISRDIRFAILYEKYLGTKLYIWLWGFFFSCEESTMDVCFPFCCDFFIFHVHDSSRETQFCDSKNASQTMCHKFMGWCDTLSYHTTHWSNVLVSYHLSHLFDYSRIIVVCIYNIVDVELISGELDSLKYMTFYILGGDKQLHLVARWGSYVILALADSWNNSWNFLLNSLQVWQNRKFIVWDKYADRPWRWSGLISKKVCSMGHIVVFSLFLRSVLPGKQSRIPLR